MPSLRVVLDPNVLVSAFISPSGPTSAILDSLDAGELVPIASRALLAELAEVLHRDKFRAYATLDEVAAYIEGIAQKAEPANDPDQMPVVSRDRNDDYLVALARSSRADVLVSGGDDLTSLALDDVVILTPRWFTDRLSARR